MAGKQGGEVTSVNHSRGSLTLINAMHDFNRQGKELLPFGDVLFNGAAANAQEAADLLQRISETGKMFQSTHVKDRVGTWIGRNEGTGGEKDVSSLESHSAYTSYLPPPETIIKVGNKNKYFDISDIVRKNWGKGGYSEPKRVLPSKPKPKKESDDGG